MKRLSIVTISIFSLVALRRSRAGGGHSNQTGGPSLVRPESHPGIHARVELHRHARRAYRVCALARGRGGGSVPQLFIGPNYTTRMGNLTLKGSLWYYYMGYPMPRTPSIAGEDPLRGPTFAMYKLSTTASNCHVNLEFLAQPGNHSLPSNIDRSLVHL